MINQEFRDFICFSEISGGWCNPIPKLRWAFQLVDKRHVSLITSQMDIGIAACIQQLYVLVLLVHILIICAFSIHLSIYTYTVRCTVYMYTYTYTYLYIMKCCTAHLRWMPMHVCNSMDGLLATSPSHPNHVASEQRSQGGDHSK